MKKKYIKPKLVNIVTVEAGKDIATNAEGNGKLLTRWQHVQAAINATDKAHIFAFGEQSRTVHFNAVHGISDKSPPLTLALAKEDNNLDHGPS